MSTEQASSEPRLLKSGKPAHNFTQEERLKGARRSAEARKERAKSHSQRVRDRVERKEKILVDVLIEKAAEGSIQALQTLWAYAYGTPAKVEPEELDVHVSSSVAPRSFPLEDVLEAARKAGLELPESVTKSAEPNGDTDSDT